MQNIKLVDNTIKNANDQLRMPKSLISDSRGSLAQAKNRLEWKVRTRSQADSRLSKVCSDLNQLEGKIKQIERFVQTSSQRYFEIDTYLATKALGKSGSFLNIYKSLASLGAIGILGRNAGLQFITDAVTAKTLLQQGKNLNFKMYKKDGKIFFKMIGAEMRKNNSFQYNHYNNSLMKEFGGHSGTYRRRFVDRMINGGGIPLYVRGKVIKGNYEIFSKMGSVSTYINSKVDPIGNVKKTFNSNFKQSIQVWDDFNWKEVSNIQKAGKFLGAAGTVLTVGDNFLSTFKNSTGTGWDFSKGNQRKFLVDTTVDLSVAAGSIAAGAAIGSFIIPPVGTVVGTAAGAAIHFGANVKLDGTPPMSIVDHTKNVANTVVDKVADVGSSIKNLRNEAIVSIGKNVAKIFF